MGRTRMSPGRRAPSASFSLWRAAAVGVTIVVLTAGAVLSLLTAGPALEASRERRGDLAALDLSAVRSELVALHHDTLVAALQAARQGDELDGASIDRLRAARQPLIAELRRLADADGTTGEAAAEMLARHERTPLDEPVDLGALDELRMATIFTDMHLITDPTLLGGDDDWPLDVLARALVVDLANSSTPPPTPVAAYVDATVAMLDGGDGLWLGGTPELLIEDGDGVGTDAGFGAAVGVEEGIVVAEHEMVVGGAVAFEVGEEGAIPAMPVAGGSPGGPEEFDENLMTVVDYDLWLYSGRRAGDRPPITIEELTAATTAVVDEGRPSRRASMAAARAERAASGPTPLEARLRVGGGLTAAAAVVVVMGALLTSEARRRYRLSEAAFTDVLTGLGNRRFLDEEVAGRCEREHFRHVVAMIDLDRFKLVNDTWGHDAGDRLLKVVAEGLTEVITSYEARFNGLVGAAIRPGGDEFVLALHLPTGVEVDDLEETVRALTGMVDVGGPEPVELAFSVGLAAADGPADLVSLLKGADLAAYEDKATRRRDRATGADAVEVEGADRVELHLHH